jgi:hypothetical protein
MILLEQSATCCMSGINLLGIVSVGDRFSFGGALCYDDDRRLISVVEDQ